MAFTDFQTVARHVFNEKALQLEVADLAPDSAFLCYICNNASGEAMMNMLNFTESNDEEIAKWFGTNAPAQFAWAWVVDDQQLDLVVAIFDAQAEKSKLHLIAYPLIAFQGHVYAKRHRFLLRGSSLYDSTMARHSRILSLACIDVVKRAEVSHG